MARRHKPRSHRFAARRACCAASDLFLVPDANRHCPAPAICVPMPGSGGSEKGVLGSERHSVLREYRAPCSLIPNVVSRTCPQSRAHTRWRRWSMRWHLCATLSLRRCSSSRPTQCNMTGCASCNHVDRVISVSQNFPSPPPPPPIISHHPSWQPRSCTHVLCGHSALRFAAADGIQPNQKIWINK